MNRTTKFIGAISATMCASAANAGVALEEIVVTAQKRAESVQDVPIAMQAFSGEAISDLGVQKASDITKLAPNLNIATQNAMSQQIVIRGVGTNDFFGNAPGSVGLYMDEVTMSAPFLGGLGLYDMERVEVLRGPQNSLFGRNTTGGAVNYISVQPEIGGETTGYLRTIYGSHDRIEFEGAVGFSLNDTMAVRLAAKNYQRDGIWNNLDDGDSEYGDQDRNSFRATLRWEPTDASSFTFNYHNAFEDSESLPTKGVGSLNPAMVTGGPITGAAIGSSEAFGTDIDFDRSYNTVNNQGLNPSTDDWEDIYKTGAAKSDIDLTGGYIKFVHDFETMTLSVIASYDDVRTLYSEDDGLSGNVRGGLDNDVLVIDMDQAYKQKSAELRLASSGDGNFRWIVGFYYFEEDSLLTQTNRWGSNPGVAPFTPFVQNAMLFSIADLGNEVYSPYAHTDYNLTDDLKLTIGLRYTEDTKSNPSYFGGGVSVAGLPQDAFYGTELTRQVTTGLPVCTAPWATFCQDDVKREDLEFTEWGGKIGLDWQANDAMMVYGSYSRGFKSGKHDVEFLHNEFTTFPQTPQDVETLDAWEIGFKSDLLDGSMQLNGALFYSVWKDQQLLNVGPQGPEFLNLPESEIMGLEVELKWRPAENWMISGGAGFLDSEITDATGIDVAEEGHELPLVADFSLNGMIIYDIPLESGMLSLQTDFQYRTESKVKMNENLHVDEYDAVFEMNARAGYTFGDAEQYEVAVFVDNITEEERCLQKEDLAGISGVWYCMPSDGIRTFGISAEINF